MTKKTSIGIFTLAMINVAAIVSLKNLPITAEYGLTSVFYLVFAAIVFFVPLSLIAAELATGWPGDGGVFLWVKEALGPKFGFLAIWLQWVENVIWYPTALSFTAATLAYAINPDLATNKVYMLVIMMVVFWGSTLINSLGMKASGMISSVGVIIGTLIPGALIIILGVVWVIMGKPAQIDFTWQGLIPDLGNMNNWVLMAGVLLGLAGMEMSAVHAKEVKNPHKNYPRAILLSTIIIITLVTLGSLAIATVVPKGSLSLVSGVMEAFKHFFESYNLGFLVPVIAILTAIGAVAQISTWIVGPTKGLLATARHGYLPPKLQIENKHGMPVGIMVMQGIILSLMSLIFLLMPSINASFWILISLTAQLYLIMYLLVFVSALVLRYKQPETKRPYKVPGGIVGMWLIGGLGFLGSLFGVVVGFFPPSNLKTGNSLFYVGFLVVGIIVFVSIPFIIHIFKKPSWVKKEEDQDTTNVATDK
ncbi:amino acid permease [Patescibacteria group bacterium]|nr:amino acid permease [Patescibacteria group bacterium]